MDKKFNKIKTILKSKFFLKLFFIPFGIWFALTLLALADRSDPDALTLADFVFWKYRSFHHLVYNFFPYSIITFKERSKRYQKRKNTWKEMGGKNYF